MLEIKTKTRNVNRALNFLYKVQKVDETLSVTPLAHTPVS